VVPVNPIKFFSPPDAVVAPVPPLAIGSAVPEYAIARVPLLVTGLPLTVKILGAVRPTLVTPPEDPAGVVQLPSARKKLVVPPPEAGVNPASVELKLASTLVRLLLPTNPKLFKLVTSADSTEPTPVAVGVGFVIGAVPKKPSLGSQLTPSPAKTAPTEIPVLPRVAKFKRVAMLSFIVLVVLAE
jgi:hypothetical protein